MPVIAFNFTRINARRASQRTGAINIKNAVVMKDAIKSSLVLGAKEQAVLRVLFEFTSTYAPDWGEITLEGELVFFEKPEKLESLAKSWQKDKKLPREDAREIINTLLSKCNVEAILLSRELNLPSPIELPRVAAA